MNNWLKAHKKKVIELAPNQMIFEAIPISALLELTSKSGEQLARDYAVSMGFKLELASGADIMRSFLEAYNLQQVKIEALKKERDAYYDELHAKRIEVEELRDAVVKFQAELFEAVNNPNYENTQP